MDRGELEDEQETLNSITVTLLRLAVLAEFLCVRPLSLRVPVLALLRPAEAVARAFAVERAGGALALPPAAVPGADGDDCAEALRLARCFRVLASVIGALQVSPGDGCLAAGRTGVLRNARRRWCGGAMRSRRGARWLSAGAGRFDTS